MTKPGIKSTETYGAGGIIAACVLIASQSDSETVTIACLAIAAVVALGYAALRTFAKKGTPE